MMTGQNSTNNTSKGGAKPVGSTPSNSAADGGGMLSIAGIGVNGTGAAGGQS